MLLMAINTFKSKLLIPITYLFMQLATSCGGDLKTNVSSVQEEETTKKENVIVEKTSNDVVKTVDSIPWVDNISKSYIAGGEFDKFAHYIFLDFWEYGKNPISENFKHEIDSLFDAVKSEDRDAFIKILEEWNTIYTQYLQTYEDILFDLRSEKYNTKQKIEQKYASVRDSIDWKWWYTLIPTNYDMNFLYLYESFKDTKNTESFVDGFRACVTLKIQALKNMTNNATQIITSLALSSVHHYTTDTF
jgi:hypothetical protein